MAWFLATLTLLMLGVATPAAADDIDDCNQSSNPELRVRGCAGRMETGKPEWNKLALGYYHRGNASLQKGDLDGAIADYDRALEIDPNLAYAYYNRGLAYHQGKGDLDRAFTDYDRALEIDPKLANAYNNRGAIYGTRGDLDRAIADFDRAIEIDPNYAAAYGNRGEAYYLAGRFEAAVPDLRRYAGSGSPYGMLWLFMAQGRAGQDAARELAANAARLTSKEWPYPVIDLYLGHQSADAVFATVSDPDRRCEAHFYLGEWHLMQGRQDEAIPRLRSAAEKCPTSFDAYLGAVAELKRIAR